MDRFRRPVQHDDTILVLGLGRFGMATARRLAELGVEVMAVDRDPARVDALATELQHVAVLNATDAHALRQLGLDHVTVAIVAMSDLESSIVTVLELKEAGVQEVWAKASGVTHGEILQRVGADHVVYPEADAGRRVAHSVARHLIDYFEFEDGFAIARAEAPEEMWDKTLAQSQVRTRHRVTVVGVKREGEEFVYALADTMVLPHDHLILSGARQDLEQFAALD